jgi:3-oxoacyl-[acyl-carrier-protein] synthase-1
MSTPLAILNTGLVTSVGLSAPTSCAAIRAKVTNPSETCFIGAGGDRIVAHAVPLEKPWRGLAKLAHMAAMAAEESLADVPKSEWSRVPLLLCVAESERPGRMDGLDDRLFAEIQQLLGTRFAAGSAIVPHGRAAAAMALSQARTLVQNRKADHVLIVAADSLLSWPTLSHYERQDRLLTPRNSNGFMPGEGAGAILIGEQQLAVNGLTCLGLAFGVESARVDSEVPLRAHGLAGAVKAALVEAGRHIDDVACRVTDLSGEQYYFKEATLALSRTLRQRRENLELWHPAESVGETGAASGAICIALAHEAAMKRYLPPGHTVLLHFANDVGDRAALVAGFGG